MDQVTKYVCNFMVVNPWCQNASAAFQKVTIHTICDGVNFQGSGQFYTENTVYFITIYFHHFAFMGGGGSKFLEI